ncbi:MAG: hypothetical protein ACOX0U_05915 [Oscillospiraceae bacterium]|jgi:hypothetical protein
MAAIRTRGDLYNGNAAYDLSYVGNAGAGTHVGHPDPTVRPRTRTKAKPKSRSRVKLRVRKQQKISPMAVVGFLAVAAFAVVLLLSYADLMAVSDRVVRLKSESKELKKQEAILQAKYERTFDLNAIEENFTSLGTMAKPRADQVVYVDMSEPDSAQVIQKGTGQTAPDGVKNFLAMAVEYFK